MRLEAFLNRSTLGTMKQRAEKIQEVTHLDVTYSIPHFAFAKGLRALRTLMDSVAPAFKQF